MQAEAGRRRRRKRAQKEGGVEQVEFAKHKDAILSRKVICQVEKTTL